ncbi:MAG TPA: peptide deformylase [Chthoniobacteraceae bacterium]|jgi:peptide deformylase
MILEIVKYGHPVLRAKGAPVRPDDPKIRALAEDMLETMRDADGVGLAAQQVGVAVQLTVIDVSDVEDRPSTMEIGGKRVRLEDWMPLILLNPQLELGKEKEAGTEGCLSFPDLTDEISRSVAVKARAQLLDGKEIEFEATGLLARALQHEVDHLNGVLFIDRMNSATKATLGSRLKRMQKEMR